MSWPQLNCCSFFTPTRATQKKGKDDSVTHPEQHACRLLSACAGHPLLDSPVPPAGHPKAHSCPHYFSSSTRHPSSHVCKEIFCSAASSVLSPTETLLGCTARLQGLQERLCAVTQSVLESNGRRELAERKECQRCTRSSRGTRTRWAGEGRARGCWGLQHSVLRSPDKLPECRGRFDPIDALSPESLCKAL